VIIGFLAQQGAKGKEQMSRSQKGEGDKEPKEKGRTRLGKSGGTNARKQFSFKMQVVF